MFAPTKDAMRTRAIIVIVFGLAAGAACRGTPPQTDDLAASTIELQSGREQTGERLVRSLSRLHAINVAIQRSAAVARDRAHDPRVRDLATHLAFDHEADDRRVLALAKEKSLRLDPPEVVVAKLDALRGPDLDREFLRSTAQWHGEAIELLAGTDGSTDGALHEYVDAARVMLDAHMREAHRLLDDVR